MANIEVNGKKIDNGQTVTVDHSVQVFTVVVRSLQSVHPDRLKDLIQAKFEVIRCEQVEHDTYVNAGQQDFTGG